MYLRVVRISGTIQELIPGHLVLADVVPQACGVRPVKTIDIFVYLRVISRVRLCSDTEYMTNRLTQLGYKMRAVVG